MNKEYKMAVAMLQFKSAYRNLVAASSALPELDVSDGYPFYLLDFESISDAVSAWCTIHATRLLRSLPDKVDNPACLGCKFHRTGLGADGLCRGAAELSCKLYPMIIFSKEQVAAFLQEHGVENVTELSEDDAYIAFVERMEEAYEKNNTDGRDAIEESQEETQ